MTNRLARKRSRHHIRPRSRISSGNKHHKNIVEWDDAFHRSWHRVFGNMTLEEIHEFINKVSKPGDCWTQEKINKLKDKLKEES